MRRKMTKKWVSALALLLGIMLLFSGCGNKESAADGKESAASATEAEQEAMTSEKETDAEEQAETTAEAVEQVTSLVRASFLSEEEEILPDDSFTPAAQPYSIDSDLGNVTNSDRYKYLLDNLPGAKDKLAENGFVIDADGLYSEFFPIYESNRYGQYANFVTVDSLMHTYHLAFALVLRKTEKEYLYDELGALSYDMLQAALSQYEMLKGSDWETAAAFHAGFFAVGCRLLDQETVLPEELEDVTDAQYDQIMDASAMADSALFGFPVDFTQFIPRGYYEGDPIMESYFRAMMWYGLVGLPIKNGDDANKVYAQTALLMTLALDGSRLETWEKIYTVTSFFAGASDDLTYYEMRPAVDAAYGDAVYLSDLPETPEQWEDFYDLTETLRAPVINSMLTLNDKKEEVQKEFRFMGQRYTVDAEIFQNLCYKEVKLNADGDKRMLPDTLDVAASMGSDTAVAILNAQGDTEYEGYTENLEMLKEKFTNEEDPVWSASLYSSWLDTLHPLMKQKEEGYPFFMQSEEWAKKALETFAGSYAELKHDTVLYAKQMAVEMGGGDQEYIDDRGYVEPEPEVYARFVNLSQKTRDGLKQYDMLSSENEESLNILTELGQQLLTISQKELSNETLTDEEYELIRSYGGTIEHFWRDLATEITGEQYVQTSEFPAETIVDIATDQDRGRCLEIGVGGASEMYVIVPVDGELKIASGAVYNFYQFEQPISERLTDSQWREMVRSVDQPDWTQSYRVSRPDTN